MARPAEQSDVARLERCATILEFDDVITNEAYTCAFAVLATIAARALQVRHEAEPFLARVERDVGHGRRPGCVQADRLDAGR